jgi:Trehalose receptor
VSLAALLFFAFYSVWILQNKKFDLSNFVNLVVYLSNCITLILFLKLTPKWTKLIECWENVEAITPDSDSNRIRHQLNLRLFVIASSSLSKLVSKSICKFLIENAFSVEYTLQTLGKFAEARKCNNEQVTRAFYINSYPSIFQIIDYSPVVGFIAKLMSYVITLTWAYRDLFVINIAFALKSMFNQLNETLSANKYRANPSDFWSQQRLNYRKLASLVTEVDMAICSITFLSLAINVFFVCVHLFNGLT